MACVAKFDLLFRSEDRGVQWMPQEMQVMAKFIASAAILDNQAKDSSLELFDRSRSEVRSFHLASTS